MRRWLHQKIFPSYDCEDCIGCGTWGCYCATMGAFHPGVGNKRWEVWLSKLLGDGK